MGVIACKCCNPCSVCTDNWDAIADGSDISTGTGCGWTKVSGTWAIVSHQLQCTAAGIATVNAVPATSMQIVVDINAANTGDKARVVVKYNSVSDYYFAEITVGTSGSGGALGIFQRVGGSDVSLASSNQTFAAGTTYTLTVCAAGQSMSATESVTGRQVLYTLTTALLGLGTGAGLAVGTVTSSVAFDNFSLTKTFDGSNLTCPACGCDTNADTFTRSNSANINTSSPYGWTVDNGSFSIASNKLATSSTMAAAKFGAPRPNYDMSIQVDITLPADGDTARVLLNYIDKDNYWAAEFVASASGALPVNRLRILTRVAGVETVITDQLQNWGNTNTGMTVCFNSVTNRLTVSPPSPSHFATAIMPTPTSLYVGLGTGATLSAGMTFDNFSVTQTSAGCSPCPTCCTGTIPNQVRVTLAGLSSGGASTCGSCGSLNGTYVLTLIGRPSPWSPVQGYCVWCYAFPSPVCGYAFLYAFADTVNGLWDIRLTAKENNYDPAGGVDTVAWHTGFSSITNVGCDTESSLTVPYAFGGAACVGASSATLTTL